MVVVVLILLLLDMTKYNYISYYIYINILSTGAITIVG